MTIDADKALLGCAMLTAFIALGCACWGVRERGRAAHLARVARRHEATAGRLRSLLAAHRAEQPHRSLQQRAGERAARRRPNTRTRHTHGGRGTARRLTRVARRAGGER